MPETRVEIPAGTLRLEAMAQDGHDGLSAVILHPHPQYGGDMDNHVVTAIAGVLASAGASTLRVNFRGTGKSDGSYDKGRGEVEDARASIAFACERWRSGRVVLAGYSFGAAIAAAAADASLAGLILVSPPLGTGAFPASVTGLPTLVVTGDQDPISPADAVRALSAPGVDAVVVAGANHGWWPGIDELEAAVGQFVRRLRQEP
jgi:alpha/beta superfamily hydrolase